MLIFWIGKRISASHQHHLAFATIILLFVGILPQLNNPQIAPGIVLSLGMMLFALHISTYYSGTPKNSAINYAIILIISSLVLAQIVHPVFQSLSFARFILVGTIWLLLIKLEEIISASSYSYARSEIIFMWVWFISSSFSLLDNQIQILPDLIFLILVFTHFEKRWPDLHVPAAIIALYGILFMWHAHFLATVNQTIWANNDQIVPFSQILITTLLLIGLMILAFRTRSITKRYLYLFIAHETLVLGFLIENIFSGSGEMNGLLRMLLFIALSGLFVMIESREGKGLTNELIKGLWYDRPRITLGMIVVGSMFVLHPLIYLPLTPILHQVIIILLAVIGIFMVGKLYLECVKQTDSKYRILRPSVSIWSTVVFTILWAAVTYLEVLTKGYFG